MMIFKKLYTRLFWVYVGRDPFGNTYYKKKTSHTERRWVLYRGLQEASKVPAEWYGWLHHTQDTPTHSPCYYWQIPHRPHNPYPGLHPGKQPFNMGYRSRFQSWQPASS